MLYSEVGLKVGVSEINIRNFPGGVIVALKAISGSEILVIPTVPVSCTFQLRCTAIKSTSLFSPAIPKLISTTIGAEAPKFPPSCAHNK